jgi:hypothetical protein
MSLISRKSIQHAGPDRHDEIVVSFRREKDGTYTKVTSIMSRDWKTGGVKQFKRDTPVEDGPYTLIKEGSGDFDEKMMYEDIDSTVKYMYFKKIEK